MLDYTFRAAAATFVVFGLSGIVLAPDSAAAQTPTPGVEYAISDGEDAAYPATLSLYGGGRLVSEQYTGNTGIGRVGGAFRYEPFARFVLDARYASEFTRRNYLTRTLNPELGQKRFQESLWDTSVNFGYEVLGTRVLDGDFALRPYLGLRLRGVVNDAFPWWGGFPRFGFVAGYRATPRLRFQGGADVGVLGFGRRETYDVLGVPRYYVGYQASTLFQFGSHYAFRLAMTGEHVWRRHAHRQSFGVLGGVEIRFGSKRSSDAESNE